MPGKQYSMFLKNDNSCEYCLTRFKKHIIFYIVSPWGSNQMSCLKIIGSHSSVAEDAISLGCDTVSVGGK